MARSHRMPGLVAGLIGFAVVALVVVVVFARGSFSGVHNPPSPLSLTVTAGDRQNEVSCTVPTSTDNILIQYSTQDYPRHPTEGIQAYLGPAATFVHRGLTNGVDYYYTVWTTRTGEKGLLYSRNHLRASATPVWIGPNGEHETEPLLIAGGDGHTITLHNNPDARDPTWSQLLTFLTNDTTDGRPYVYGSFVCADFAEVLHNNAEKAGIRAGYVGLGLDGDPFAHAADVFNTTDRGLVYIDDTGTTTSNPCSADKTVVVSVGQQYIPQSISPCPGYSSTWLSMGTITGVTLHW
jgi:hypothetical protein